MTVGSRIVSDGVLDIDDDEDNDKDGVNGGRTEDSSEEGLMVSLCSSMSPESALSWRSI